jgi:hypothetical protein
MQTRIKCCGLQIENLNLGCAQHRGRGAGSASVARGLRRERWRNEKRADRAGLSTLLDAEEIAYPWAIVVLSRSGFWTCENSTAKPFSR